jgi:hypothetical protein
LEDLQSKIVNINKQIHENENKHLKEIENMELINEEEYQIILNYVQQVYTTHSELELGISFDNALMDMCKRVINIKKNYPKWNLIKMELTQINLFYFQDDKGCCFQC